MKDRRDYTGIIVCVTFFIMIGAILGLSYLLYSAVINSSMPDWLKWIILRR